MKYIISQHPSIEDASKDIDIDGNEYTGEHGQISEWAVAVALNSFPLESVVTEEEFVEALKKAVAQQTLDGLVEKELIEASWDEEKGEVVYHAKRLHD